MIGSSDGVWFGIKYFDSQPGRGLFVPVTQLKPSMNFSSGSNSAVIASNGVFI